MDLCPLGSEENGKSSANSSPINKFGRPKVWNMIHRETLVVFKKKQLISTNTHRHKKILRDETQRDVTNGQKRNDFDIFLCEEASLRSASQFDMFLCTYASLRSPNEVLYI